MIQKLDLGNNCFEGSLNFLQLPDCLTEIRLAKNRFSGTVNLSYLPENMLCLDAQHNTLTGTAIAPPGDICLLNGNEGLTVRVQKLLPRDEYQTACMRNIIGDNNKSDRAKGLNVGRSAWAGVTWRNKIVVGITWGASTIVKLNGLEWLPPSLERAEITGIAIRANLETRLLPKYLEYADFSSCRLHGTLELRTLPSRLEEFHVARNNFAGDISLTSLPTCMVLLNLERNKLARVFISNFQLPKCLRSVQL
ncbi:hypothetical protein XU18_0759 [Perkinsela sp. CCAP 1560/4]|nr:hypothetical protein XU18_0759 [Perkinsela sp. CCAP 1560/4]|eukprot:KNH08795.1 hypothetical protein XU18_0759 [Perkinsela sp. CCAP 1560/4]